MTAEQISDVSEPIGEMSGAVAVVVLRVWTMTDDDGLLRISTEANDTRRIEVMDPDAIPGSGEAEAEAEAGLSSRDARGPPACSSRPADGRH